VRVVASKVSGMGKSLYVKRLAQKLQKECPIKSQHVIVPIHGPVVNADTVMASLCNHVTENTPTAQIIHFDIASSVSNFDILTVATYGISFSYIYCIARILMGNKFDELTSK